MITLSLISASVIYAQDNQGEKEHSTEYYQSLAEFVDRSPEELKVLETKYGDLEKLLGVEVNSNNPYASSSHPYPPMSDKLWKTMKNASQKGDILISKDNGKGGITYGHAGIVYRDNSITVKHLGGASLSIAVAYDSWRSHYTM